MQVFFCPCCGSRSLRQLSSPMLYHCVQCVKPLYISTLEPTLPPPRDSVLYAENMADHGFGSDIVRMADDVEEVHDAQPASK